MKNTKVYALCWTTKENEMNREFISRKKIALRKATSLIEESLLVDIFVETHSERNNKLIRLDRIKVNA